MLIECAVSLRLMSPRICTAVLDGQDTMTVMPTGIVTHWFHPYSLSHSCAAAGKSLTYQLPAIFCRGLTIVISPLIALMNDQIQHLRDVGGECVHISKYLSLIPIFHEQCQQSCSLVPLTVMRGIKYSLRSRR